MRTRLAPRVVGGDLLNYLCQLFVLSSRDQLTRSVLLSFHPERPESACQVGEMGVGWGCGGGVVFYLGGVQGEMWKRVVVVILPRSARGNASARCHLGCPVDTVDAPVTILFLKKKSC